MMSSTAFSKPEADQVRAWYDWVFSLNHGKNPFDPKDGGKSWNTNQANNKLIWLAGITATTEPAYKPSKIPNLNALVSSSQGKTVYNDGTGKPTPTSPSIALREISIGNDTRDLYCAVSSEFAPEVKYPTQPDLQACADKIIDRENVKGSPPAFIELNNNELKDAQLLQYRVRGSYDQFDIPANNIFMLPSGKGESGQGKAAFSDYAVIVKRSALNQTENTLKFGVHGEFFEYTVEYKIKVQTISTST